MKMRFSPPFLSPSPSRLYKRTTELVTGLEMSSQLRELGQRTQLREGNKTAKWWPLSNQSRG